MVAFILTLACIIGKPSAEDSAVEPVTVAELAESYCARSRECLPNRYSSYEGCVERWTLDQSEACFQPELALLECLQALSSCAEHEAYWDEPIEDFPCVDEERAWLDCPE